MVDKRLVISYLRSRSPFSNRPVDPLKSALETRTGARVHVSTELTNLYLMFTIAWRLFSTPNVPTVIPSTSTSTNCRFRSHVIPVQRLPPAPARPGLSMPRMWRGKSSRSSMLIGSPYTPPACIPLSPRPSRGMHKGAAADSDSLPPQAGCPHARRQSAVSRHSPGVITSTRNPEFPQSADRNGRRAREGRGRLTKLRAYRKRASAIHVHLNP
jgi:hypothetical protein